MYNIITKKKHGLKLTKEEIDYVVKGFTNGVIPDYQMSALLMAICINKMDEEETYNLTMAMAESGDMLSLDSINRITADKHSTGGVGDKTSLIVAPVASLYGVAMAKMSGRGLGHTGGTIDKLESIEGFDTALSEDEFIEVVNDTGVAIIAQTANLAPADKLMYALRDVTATVDNISLISSSIMSKKLAAGAKVIVLDVKTGSGAFMKSIEDSKELARTMIDIGLKADRKMYALISDMDRPLGKYIGNKLEVYEAVKLLQGEYSDDLYEACEYLTALILVGAAKADNLYEGREMFKDAVKSGRGLEQFKRFISAQKGNTEFIDNIDSFVNVKSTIEIKARQEGYITHMNTEMIGLSAMYLGGGRATKNDIIDPDVGIQILKKTGEYVNSGDVLAVLYVNDEKNLDKAVKTIIASYQIGKEKPSINDRHAYGYFDGLDYKSIE